MLLSEKLGKLGDEHVGMVYIDMDTAQAYVVAQYAVSNDGRGLEYGVPYHFEYRWEPLPPVELNNSEWLAKHTKT